MDTSPFDSIRRVTREKKIDFWSARELMVKLGYDTWRRFEDAIERVMEACDNTSGRKASQGFLPVSAKTLDIGGRPGKDYLLSRYACYLPYNIYYKVILSKR